MFSAKRTSTADDVRKVLLTALIAALEDQKEKKQPRRGFTGVKALATGVVLYTAGRAGGRLLTERLQAESDSGEREEEDERYEEEEYEEPEAEADEEYDEADEDEEYDEEDEEYEEEPEAEADEDEADEDDEDEYDEDEQDDIPERPSRSRAPVGRS